MVSVVHYSKLSKIHTYNLVKYWLCNALFICKPKTKFEGAKIFSMFQSIFLEKHSDSKLIMNYLFRKWLWKNSYHWFLLSWKAIEVKTKQESPNKHINWQTTNKQTNKQKNGSLATNLSPCRRYFEITLSEMLARVFSVVDAILKSRWKVSF